MPSSDTAKKPLAVDFNEERLRAWKEKRAKIASVSRQERARQAEAERADRAKTLEAEKEQRLKDAAEQRAAEEAEKKAERLNAARIRLAGRADVDAARSRLLEYRRKAARRLAARVSGFVILPTVLVGAYLAFIATPLYEARSQFAIRSDTVLPSVSQVGGLLTQPARHQEAAQLRAYILSPQVMTQLDEQDSFFAHLGSEDMDVFSRLRAVPVLQVTELDQYRRAVKVTINAQEGIITLATRARTPEQAEAFAATVLGSVESYLSDPAGTLSKSLQVISAPTASHIAAYPRRIPALALTLLGFAAAFTMFSIFGATLRRHSNV